MDTNVIGRIHSHETFGALDGPGLRYVLFLQGCGLRCLYCHNPDTWVCGGKEVTSGEVLADILGYRNFIRSGGVTFSGGEPLLQPEFVEALCRGCRENRLHTAIDTAGAVDLEKCRGAVDAADLIILDIKSADPEMCIKLTGEDNRRAFELLDHCQSIGKPVWIRQVVVPGYTLADEQVRLLREKLRPYTCVEKTALLPFHRMGLYKWENLGIPCQLAEVSEPTEIELRRATDILEGKIR